MSEISASLDRAGSEFAYSPPEATIEELRLDLLRALGDFANQNFSERYGPLIGSFVEIAVEEFLLGFETNIEKSKNEISFLIHELMNRILHGISK